MNPLLAVVIGMALVTYIPRMLPLVFLQELNLPTKVEKLLEFIPAAVLGALIFPGILSATDSTASALAGGLAALILAHFDLNLIILVAGSVLTVLGWEILF